MLRKFTLFAAALALCLSMVLPAGAEGEQGKSVFVRMDTTLGPIVLELWPDKAPQTVRNFLKYVVSGFYDGTIFHRVIPNFMIQGGGFTEDMRQKDTLPAIENEATNGLKNKEYTIAMARTNDPHSATGQFFINVANNGFLDHTAPDMNGWGYCVFGQVAAGKGVVDKIKRVKTKSLNRMADVPVTPVVIQKASVVEQ